MNLTFSIHRIQCPMSRSTKRPDRPGRRLARDTGFRRRGALLSWETLSHGPLTTLGQLQLIKYVQLSFFVTCTKLINFNSMRFMIVIESKSIRIIPYKVLWLWKKVRWTYLILLNILLFYRVHVLCVVRFGCANDVGISPWREELQITLPKPGQKTKGL